MSATQAFRARALRGDKLLGTVVASSDIALAEVVAAQFDFVWIDLEHSALTVRDVQSLCIAARASRCATLVRLPLAASALLTALLDIGVDGVIAPRVEEVEVAAAFAAGLRYPPDGSRGFAHRRATAYGLDGRPTSPEHAPLCLVQVESRVAVERAAALAGVDGVDGLVVGPNDLAFDLGLDGDLRSPELLAAIAAVQSAARDAGVIAGLAAGGDRKLVADVLGGFSTLLAYSADVRMYAQAVESSATAMRAAWTAATSPA